MNRHWIWEQPDWPQFRWDAALLQTALHRAHVQRLQLQEQLNQLDASLQEEAAAALLSRERLSTAGIEGEQLDPAEVRSSVARRLQLPLESQQPRPSAKVDGLVQTLFTATSNLEAPIPVRLWPGWVAHHPGQRRAARGGSDAGGIRADRPGNAAFPGTTPPGA